MNGFKNSLLSQFLYSINKIMNAFDDALQGKDLRSTLSDDYFSIRCLLAVREYLTLCYQKLDKVKNDNNIATFLKNISSYYKLSGDKNALFNDKYCDLIYDDRFRIDQMIKKYT